MSHPAVRYYAFNALVSTCVPFMVPLGCIMGCKRDGVLIMQYVEHVMDEDPVETLSYLSKGWDAVSALYAIIRNGGYSVMHRRGATRHIPLLGIYG